MSAQTTRAEAETHAVAASVARLIRPGDVLLLRGDLGAGKTAFVRGLAEGLGLDPDEVSSPTFTLVHEYRGGRLPLVHVDLYRLPDGAGIDDLALDELAEAGVLVVEWPERMAQTIPGAHTITFAIVDETTRVIGGLDPLRERTSSGG